MQLGFSFPDPESEPVEPLVEENAPIEKVDHPAQDVEDAPSAVAEGPEIYSVSALTRAIRGVLEGTFGEVWVRGEVSNLRRQASGHQYFTLKDDTAQISCVLFSGASRRMRGGGLRLNDGTEVQVLGELTVYEARGQYQLVVRIVQEAGIGALQARFEALKASLAAEGLFDPERKRPLPRFPMRIGVVTSPTGAAIRDFLNVIGRRMPAAEIIIHPVRVQGKGAAGEIAAAIDDFSKPGRLPEVDVVVVTRGGGSLEDLWEFNEEIVARAIAASEVPVVSAVGHEIDFTISDFAADLRAPTPSAAAELIVADASEVWHRIVVMVGRLRRELVGHARLAKARLETLTESALVREPQRALRERNQRLDQATDTLVAAAERMLRERSDRIRHAQAVLSAHRPDRHLGFLQSRLATACGRLPAAALRQIQETRKKVDAASALLSALGPEATLARGFTLTFGPDGSIVQSTAELRPGMKLRTRFRDGETQSVVVAANRSG